MSFELRNPTIVRLASINVRSEKHGKEDVPAIDLDFELEGPNDKVLSLLHPGLVDAFYWNAEAEAGQGSLDAVPATRPNLRFPKMGSVPYPVEIHGADLTVIYGLGDEPSNIDLAECTVKVKHLTFKEGGTAIIAFQPKTSHIPEGALDKLKRLLKRQTEVTLVRPEKLREDAVIDGTVGHPALAGQAEANGQQRLDDDGAPRVGKEGNGPGWPFGTIPAEGAEHEKSAADIAGEHFKGQDEAAAAAAEPAAPAKQAAKKPPPAKKSAAKPAAKKPAPASRRKR